ncbi:hypothetical protein [Chitinophaga rhizosphaerae]|uniref:hypothetical protein n=1 Tax=Chitinophaga rhizosphaerae TaxID=1864947 RepID=UPI000F803BFF|nr:hypothetical protein [Chitinophaga rhizosphaerae]
MLTGTNLAGWMLLLAGLGLWFITLRKVRREPENTKKRWLFAVSFALDVAGITLLTDGCGSRILSE